MTRQGVLPSSIIHYFLKRCNNMQYPFKIKTVWKRNPKTFGDSPFDALKVVLLEREFQPWKAVTQPTQPNYVTSKLKFNSLLPRIFIKFSSTLHSFNFRLLFLILFLEAISNTLRELICGDLILWIWPQTPKLSSRKTFQMRKALAQEFTERL